MTKSALALTTALSLFAATQVFAQTSPDLTGVDPTCIMKNADGTETVDTTKCPDGKTMGAAETTAEPPAASTATQPSTDSTATAAPPAETTATATPPADASEANLIVPAEVMNGAKVMSASDYIGKRVYDRAGTDIGEVNDLILSGDGKIQATILGVGGFLGIGEKNVAVQVGAVEMVQEGESWKLVVDATKEQLDAAPSYDPASRRYAG